MSFLFSLLVALAIEFLLKPRLASTVAARRNKAREARNLPVANDCDVWEQFVGSEPDVCLRVSSLMAGPLGRVTGILATASKPEDVVHGVVLERTDELQAVTDHLAGPLRTFVDVKTGIVCELFTQEAVLVALERYRRGRVAVRNP